MVLPADAVNDICLLLDVCSGGGCSDFGGAAFMLSVPDSVIEALSGDGLLQGLKASGLTINAAQLALGGRLEVGSRDRAALQRRCGVAPPKGNSSTRV